jgi:hypothetical protein
MGVYATVLTFMAGGRLFNTTSILGLPRVEKVDLLVYNLPLIFRLCSLANSL